MNSKTCSILAFLLLLSGGLSQAQLAQPAEEHKILKADVGTWKASARMFAPGMPQEEAPGTEVNTMIGEFWLNSVYTMDFMGTEFTGQATLGYDQASKQFVASWVDSMNPFPMHMTGTWDEETRTMTMMTDGKGPDGVQRQGKSTTVTSVDGNTRVMTMYDRSTEADSKWVKSMVITYTRVKE